MAHKIWLEVALNGPWGRSRQPNIPVREDDIVDFRLRGMTPDRPLVRGTAQNPDVFFQAREACNPFYLAVPGIVQDVFDEFADRTGRRYSLVEYHGAPDADRVIVVMGSAVGAVRETVDTMVDRGERVGVVTVRLYRPFPAAELKKWRSASPDFLAQWEKDTAAATKDAETPKKVAARWRQLLK